MGFGGFDFPFWRAQKIQQIKYESVRNVSDGDDQKNIARRKPREHSDGGDNQNQIDTAATAADGFKARVANRADHQKS